jgi:hypothetical protein
MNSIKRALQWVGGAATVLFIIGVFTVSGVLISAAYIVGVLAFMTCLVYLAVLEALSLLSPERSDGEREGERVDLSGLIDIINKQRKEKHDNTDDTQRGS